MVLFLKIKPMTNDIVSEDKSYLTHELVDS